MVLPTHIVAVEGIVIRRDHEFPCADFSVNGKGVPEIHEEYRFRR